VDYSGTTTNPEADQALSGLSIMESRIIMSEMIKTGASAPEFSLPDHLGRTISLSQFKGKRNVMLLFYPLDFTPT
jgi:hypothetical protein